MALSFVPPGVDPNDPDVEVRLECWEDLIREMALPPIHGKVPWLEGRALTRRQRIHYRLQRERARWRAVLAALREEHEPW